MDKRKVIYTTKTGEVLYSEPGNRADGDKRLLIGYKEGKPWPHTLELIGAALRAKAWVEDNNYPHGLGRWWLLGYIVACMTTSTPIRNLIKKFKIPDK